MADLLIRGERVLLPEGMRPASIRIQDGRIVAVGSVAERNSGTTTIDAGEMVVMPGLVDTHVHVNEPGRTEWEGFATATRAAAAGGITTIVDMPLNSVPATTTVMGLQAKLDAARGRCRVDVGFWGGVVPGDESQIEPLAAAGVLGFKCFLSPSGVDEFEHVTEGTLRGAMPVVAGTSLPLLVHAELPEHLRDAIAGADPSKHATWLATRPPEAEAAAVALMIALAREFGTRVHIVHVAAEAVIAQVAGAKAAGLPVTAETCPHYLSICAEEIPDGAVQFKCAPPIRERSHRDALWEALRSGTLDLVATDHSPAPPEIKGMATGDFLNGWGGIASLQLALPLVWTQARAHGFDVATISRWLSAAPARLAGLEAQKGRIAAGMDADLVIWDPDRKFQVDAATLHHRHKVTPYTGWVLQGRVERTLLRGTTVYEGGDFPGRPSGRVLRRGTANIPGR